MRRVLCALALLATCTYVLSTLSFRQAQASRNSSGTYSTPNTFVTGTTISSTNVNANFSDIATEMTDSLDRSGKGGMLAALRGIDGTVAAPAYSFTSETGTGWFRNGTNDLRLSIGGTAKGFWNATGFGVGVAPATLLHVQGASVTGKGQLYVKGISDSGYIYVDTDSPTTKESGIHFASNGTDKWELYVPANSNELHVWDSVNSVDRVKISSSGLTIGSTGTAISASYRGTVNWTPGTLAGGACVTNTITLTGSSAGTECVPTAPTAGLTSNIILACWVTANTCNLQVCNPTGGNLIPLSGNYACRVFNP